VKARGITLIELAVTVAIVAIVAVLVGPSVQQLLNAQRVRSISAELVNDVQYARSEAVRRNVPLLVRFQSDTQMTCYVIYAEIGIGRCSCLRGPGLACSGTFEEVKTVQIPRDLKVALAASSSMDTLVTFQPQAGTSRPGDFRVDVAGSIRGLLRTEINATGRPSVCSPDGSVTQVPQCR